MIGYVRIDKTYICVINSKSKRNTDGLDYRGTSNNKIRIGVGCDRDRNYYFGEGKCRCTNIGTLRAFCSHIMLDYLLLHDDSHSHNGLVADSGLGYLEWKAVDFKMRIIPLIESMRSVCFLRGG